jgi:cytochrome c biogenesis protein CcmG/thiol:disulfide interchange protein DsbE
MTESPTVKTKFRWGQLITWLGLAGLLVVLGLGVMRAQAGQVQTGQPAPDFTATAFDGTAFAGQSFSLKAARGQVVVVNFWASWCIPCRDEAAIFEEAWQHYKDRGVTFVGLAWTDTESKSLVFINEFNQTYFNAPDLGTRAGQAYRITGVPETYIVDQNGTLAWVKFSPIASLAELRSVIDPLLIP